MRDLDNHWLKTDEEEEEDQEEVEKKKESLLRQDLKQSDRSFPTFPSLDDSSSLFSNVFFESEESSEPAFGGISSLEDRFETDTPENDDDGQPQLNTFSVGVSRYRRR